MQIGLMSFPTDRGIRVDELARQAEERGYSSLFVPEHTHIPTSRESAHFQGEMPEYYKRFLDPFVALAAAAAVTDRIRLGTGICLAAQHDALILAKETASVDHLSDGRLVFGVGFGWNKEEMAHHGVDPRNSRAVLREKIAAVREVWAHDEAAFDGQHVRFSSSWSWPKPVQEAGPPVLLGSSATPLAFRDVVAWADGWISRVDAGGLDLLHHTAEEAGRDPASLRVVVLAARPDPASLEALAAQGVHEALLAVPPEDRDAGLAALERYQALVDASLEREA